MPSFFDKAKAAARAAGKFLTAGDEAEQDILRIHLNKPPAANEPADITALRKTMAEEPLRRRFARSLSRAARIIKNEALQLEDISVIKLPAAQGAQLYARRNAQGLWNVWRRTGHAQGPEPITDTLLAGNLSAPAALNALAAQSPDGMQRQSHMHWHPFTVAARIGHVFPGELGHQIPVPEGLLPPKDKTRTPKPPKR
ncbi:MAG: hypothetical protein Q8K65_01440 [Alphaproteobacteria bacterium]|nr:hypothetical protein [Alphaproteobacteria bacterium]